MASVEVSSTARCVELVTVHTVANEDIYIKLLENLFFQPNGRHVCRHGDQISA